MAERFPSPPMVEEDRDENTVQPLMVDDSWLPLYKDERLKQAVDFIVDFVRSPQKVTAAIPEVAMPGAAGRGSAACCQAAGGVCPLSASLFLSLPTACQDTEQVTRFLKCICALCGCAKILGSTQGMEIFCHGYRLAETIKMVLEEEPPFQMQTEVRRLAMLAIAKLSTVGTVLEGKEKSLLEACFSSVFWLPPKETMRNLKPTVYYKTMEGTDTLLEALVLNCPASRVSELLQIIFQLLISSCNCLRPEVRKRVVGRIRILSRLLTEYSSENAAQNEESRDFQIPNLGRLLGQLVLLLSFKEEGDDTSAMALDALCSLFILKRQKLTTLPEDHGKLKENWELQTAAPSCLETARNVTEIFAKYLQPSERTDFILRIIEGMQDFTMYDKEMIKSVVDGITGDSDCWLVDMPKIMSCIYENLRFISSESAWQGVRSLLLKMVEQCPEEAVRLLLDNAPPGNSTGLDMWEVMFSVPLALDLVVPELLKQLQQRKQKLLFCTLREDTSCLAVSSQKEPPCPRPQLPGGSRSCTVWGAPPALPIPHCWVSFSCWPAFTCQRSTLPEPTSSGGS
ncbi:maestro heat-like repeat-containing protein family member 7 isoform X1 [Heliangelus exortis]|uniref:maestro heat-like repeat-containing protein family member 7 isoform X1 n=1 Tax=Heliangelus exortis TaxID=472823 RepID=UPI003A927263